MNGSPDPKLYGSVTIFDKFDNAPVVMNIYKYKSHKDSGLVVIRGVVRKGISGPIYAGKVYYSKVNSNTPRPPISLAYNYGVGSDIEKNISRIYIDMISTNNDRFGLVGTKLMQVVYEVSLKDKYGSGGRIQLMAICDSPIFYHQLGYKSQTIPYNFAKENEDAIEKCDTPEQVDAALARRTLLPNHGKGLNLGGITMFLPRFIRDNWNKSSDFIPIIKKSK